MLHALPLAKPKPDAAKFVDVLMGRARSSVPPLVEYLVDEVVMRPIVTGLLDRPWVSEGSDRESQQAYLDTFIEFWYRLGYDFVRFERGAGFTERHINAPDTAPGSRKQRSWADEHRGSIMGWDDFASYPWPKVEEYDFFPFEYLDAHLPEGMGLVTCHGAGVYEHLSWIMSYEGLALALHDTPALVQAVADRIGEILLAFYRHLVDLPHVAVIFPGDDMGFRTGTLIEPDALRCYCLPWHKKFAAMAHRKGLPYFLHSCGNLEEIMEELIVEVGIDGKHSFEDAIIPVEQFQKRYGGRIAVLGGVDINILTRSTEEEVRRHTARIMERCGKRGRFAIGSGNSIPSYIPPENYLAMVDEAVRQRYAAGS